MITVKYSKTSSARFLSHLNIQSVIQRSIKRSGLNPKYTQGFNPRSILKMSKPTPLGVASVCEYFTIDVLEISKKEFFAKTADKTPLGIIFLDAWVTLKDPKIFSKGIVTEYEVEIAKLDDVMFNKLKHKINSGFIVEKKSKRGFSSQNVSDLICDIRSFDNKIVVELMSQENENLRINDFLKGLNSSLGMNIGLSSVIKTNQYVNLHKSTIDSYLMNLEAQDTNSS